MKLAPVTKIEKRNKTTLKKIWSWRHVRKLWRHCHFLIWGQFGAIRKPDFGRIVCKTYDLINSNLLSYKNWKQNQKISKTALTLLLWVKVLFLPKNADYCKKRNANISKIKRALVLKGKFSKTTYVCARGGNNFTPAPIPSTSKRIPKNPIQIRVKYMVLLLDYNVVRF